MTETTRNYRQLKDGDEPDRRAAEIIGPLSKKQKDLALRYWAYLRGHDSWVPREGKRLPMEVKKALGAVLRESLWTPQHGWLG